MPARKDAPPPEETWTWKSKNASRTHLLYEPGNWGDLLKGAWVAAAAEWLLEAFGREPFSYLDLFAGAPEYPLLPATRRRLAALPRSRLSAAARPTLERNRWPSAAGLVTNLLLEEARRRVRIFDLDDNRRNAWEACGEATVLRAASAWEALAKEPSPPPQGLLLLDPYDFLAEWRSHLEPVVEAAEQTNVLLYIYNRSARKTDRLRVYRDFRNALDDLRGDKPRLLGRLAADAFLPNAHHEILFLPSQATLAHPAWESLAQDLRMESRALEALQRDEACFVEEGEAGHQD